MLKLKYKDVMSFPFTEAVRKLTSLPLPIKPAYRIKRMADALQVAQKKIKAEYQELLGIYAKKDEKGELIHPDKDDPNSFDIDESKLAEYKKEEAAFGDRETIIDRDPIPAYDLGDTKVTAGELAQLDKILSFPEESGEVSGNVTPLHAG